MAADIKMQWQMCKYSCGAKLIWDSRVKRMRELTSFRFHDCPSFKDSTEIIQKILTRLDHSETILQELLCKVNSLLDERTEIID